MKDREKSTNKNKNNGMNKKPVNRPVPSPSNQKQNALKQNPKKNRTVQPDTKNKRPAQPDAAEKTAVSVNDGAKNEKNTGENKRKLFHFREKENKDDLRPLSPPKEPVKPYVRRFRKFILAAVTIVVLLGICVVLSLTVFFKIDEINVEGNTRYELTDIEEASMISKGDNLLLCNTSYGAENIVKKFPYIESVEIEKKLFNKINIKVNEATPSFVIESDGKYIVLAKSGKIIEINDKKTYDDIPAVLGAKLKNVKLCSQIEYEDENLKKYLDKIVELISEYGIKNIRTIDMTDKSNILLIRENGFKINIGNFENLEYKLKTAASILSKNVKDDAKGTLDVGIASAQGGKSYLRLGEESSEKPKESKPQSSKASSAESSQQSSGQTQTEESSGSSDDGTVEENAEPQYDEPYYLDYDDGTGDDGGYNYDDGTGDDGGYNYDDGTGDDGGYNYDDGTGDDGGYNYDDGTGDDGGYNYDDGTDYDGGYNYDDGTDYDGGYSYDDGNTYDNNDENNE